MDKILKSQNVAKKSKLVSSPFELQDMLTKIPFLVLSFESGNCVMRREKRQKIE